MDVQSLPYTAIDQPPTLTSGTRPLRVGIVGARRQAQGIGRHVARHLITLGAKVPALVGTRPETVAAACDDLRTHCGVEASGYQSLPEMLRQQRLDAVAICSPDRFHREHLETALAAGVHVLCEKPLIFEPDRDPVADVRPLVEGFAAAGKLLMVNEQWPYTLPAFAQLHPEFDRSRPPEHLSMLLCPASAGPAMVPAALPHAMSLLAALCPAGGTARRIRVEVNEMRGGAITAMTLRFQYAHAAGCTAVAVDLCQVLEQPRPAAYSVDGRSVRRLIELPEYRMSLVAGGSGRRLPIGDPLWLLLKDFLQRVQRTQATGKIDAPPAQRSPLDGLRVLRDVYAAVRAGPPQIT